MEFNYKILKILRKRNDYTQDQVADTLCLGRAAYQAKEGGRNPTSIEQLHCLADLYEIDLSEFFNFHGWETIFEKKGDKMENDIKFMYMDAIERIRELKDRIKELEELNKVSNP